MATNTYMLEYDAFIRSIKQNKNVSHAVLLNTVCGRLYLGVEA